MIGDYYWSTGILLTPYSDGNGGFEWNVSAEYFDHGFACEKSTEGRCSLRYIMRRHELPVAARMLREDMERMGIRFCVGVPDMPPTVYIEGDGESRADIDYPDDWEVIVAGVVSALPGFVNCYVPRSKPETTEGGEA